MSRLDVMVTGGEVRETRKSVRAERKWERPRWDGEERRFLGASAST